MDRPDCPECGTHMVKAGKTDSSKNQRWQCRTCKTRTTLSNDGGKDHPGYDKAAVTARMKDLKRRIAAKEIKRFVITSAQNNTNVNQKFLQALRTYCTLNSAELLVIPSHYKNLSLYTANQEYKKSWAPELEQYFIDDRLALSNSIVVRADISIPATMFNPLSGKEPIEGKRWTIFGHPQFAMESVASPIGAKAKRMYTTGSITNRNYSKTNVGAKAEFHHITGAIVVEVQGGNAWVRQLNADHTGGFYDIELYYRADGGTKPTGPILALATGDEHVKFIKRQVCNATYLDADSIVRTLRPKNIIRNDVLDGYSGSHHHEHDDVLQFRKFHKRDNDYRKELDQVVGFLNLTTPKGSTNIIVASNHHDHLYKWLARVDPRQDPLNALLIHELKTAQYQNSIEGRTTDPLEIYCAGKLTCKTRFLKRTDAFMLKGVKYDQHGDVGPNGTRGSAQSLAKTTYKMVIGHSHSARIVKGVYQVGTSTGTLEYQRGLGSHSNTHCIQYPNGKRTLIDIFGGKWRLQ